MHAELHLLIGLILIHIVWLLAYLTGTLLDRRVHAPETTAVALAEFVIRTASGLALWGFGTFIIGIAGLLNPVGFAGLLLCGAVASRLLHGPALFTRAFWKSQAARVGLAWSAPNVVLYYAALAVIVPAVLPDIDSDSVRYHLAYPIDWAVHGRIYPDYFLRLPFYPTNFQLLYAAFQTVGLAAYVHFLPWLCGALVVLATRAAIALIDERVPAAATRFERAAHGLVTFLLPLSIIVSPIFLRWTDTGLIDIPIELYAFLPALSLVVAVVAKCDLRWSAVCCGAFFIGMKVSFIAFIPLVVVFLWILIATQGGSRRARAVACLVLLAAGSPWYVRNVVYDHDPIPPVLNIALHRPDATYDRQDYAHNYDDLRTDRSPAALALLPLEAWVRPSGPNLREYGNVGLVLFLYVPFAAIGAALMFGTRTPVHRAVVVLSITSAYTVAYCLATTYLLRYMLITQPPLAASVATILLLLPAVRYVAWVRVAAAALAVLPSASALPWYNERVLDDYRYLELVYASDDGYLDRNLPGYAQTRAVLASAPFAKPAPRPRVLLVRAETEYYFRRAGIETIGDWFGPGRYRDLAMMLENDRLTDYVRHFDVGAVIVRRDQGGLDDPQFARLRSGLARLGFRTLEDEPHGFFVAVR